MEGVIEGFVSSEGWFKIAERLRLAAPGVVDRGRFGVTSRFSDCSEVCVFGTGVAVETLEGLGTTDAAGVGLLEIRPSVVCIRCKWSDCKAGAEKERKFVDVYLVHSNPRYRIRREETLDRDSTPPSWWRRRDASHHLHWLFRGD